MKRVAFLTLMLCAGLAVVPGSAFAVATLSGKVFYDPAIGTDKPIPGAVVDIRTSAHAHVKFATTAADGTWSTTVFGNASGFDYEVIVSNLYSYVSPANGTKAVKGFDNQETPNINFSVRGSTIGGSVFHDLNDDGTKQGPEPGLGGASVTIDGPVDANATTAGNGTFSSGSPVLPAGSYSITAAKGSYTASTAAKTVNATAGNDATAAAFGLHFPTGPVSGDVYAETNGTPGRQANEPPIAGVDVTATGQYDGQSFSLTTQSAFDGTFSMEVFAGSGRTIGAAQPAGYQDGPEFTAEPVVIGADKFGSVTVVADTPIGPFQFGETGASISGLAFSDRNPQGLWDAGEPGIGGRAITVTAPGFAETIMSDADGTYVVDGLPAGDVTFTPEATTDSIAPDTRILHPSAGEPITGENFGYRFTGLSGLVLNRQTNTPMAGAEVSLSGEAALSTTTGADGSWSFQELGPGTYAVRVTAPDGFLLANSAAGTLGGGTSEPGGVVGIGAGLGELGTGYELGLTPSGSPAGVAGNADADAPDFVGALGLGNGAFRAAGKSASAQAAKRRRRPVGTTVSFRLDEPATVAFSVERVLPGRRVGKRCVKATRKNGKRRKCTRYVVQRGSFSVRGGTTTTRFKFSGRLRNRKLAPGSYRLVAVATDDAGNKSVAKRVRFKIVRR